MPARRHGIAGREGKGSELKDSVKNSVDFFCRALASCLWIGYAPIAPATVCSFAVTIVLWLSGALESPNYIWIIPAIVVVGVVTATRAERAYGHDGRQIVIDEVAGQMIAFVAMPPSATVFIGGFFLFRFFDILKPFPVGRSQSLPGGLGVVADDVLAGIYANLILRVLVVLVS
jgi:phosphatidylglycerophosphatase A